MHWKLTIAIMWVSFLFASPAFAQAPKVLVTLAFSEHGTEHFWWKPQNTLSQEDRILLDNLQAGGLSVVDPQTLTNPPRFSPIVYGKATLSDVNAKNLASLFGATHNMRGTLSWHCQAAEENTHCQLKGDITLLAVRGQTLSHSVDENAVASSAREAKAIALRLMAMQTLAIYNDMLLQNRTQQAHYPEALITVRGLYTAQGLVELRKALKLIPGVEDVAERIASSGGAAIEINPHQRNSVDFVRSVCEQLVQAPSSVFTFSHDILTSPQGFILQIINYQAPH